MRKLNKDLKELIFLNAVTLLVSGFTQKEGCKLEDAIYLLRKVANDHEKRLKEFEKKYGTHIPKKS